MKCRYQCRQAILAQGYDALDTLERGRPEQVGQSAPCDIATLDAQLTEAMKAENAAYASLEATPGAPMLPPPLDVLAVEEAVHRRDLEEDSYARDCNRAWTVR